MKVNDDVTKNFNNSIIEVISKKFDEELNLQFDTNDIEKLSNSVFKALVSYLKSKENNHTYIDVEVDADKDNELVIGIDYEDNNDANSAYLTFGDTKEGINEDAIISLDNPELLHEVDNFVGKDIKWYLITQPAYASLIKFILEASEENYNTMDLEGEIQIFDILILSKAEDKFKFEPSVMIKTFAKDDGSVQE